MIRIGPAGWNYKDWSGIVYPKPKPRAFNPLAFLAGYFDTIEINSSFYGAPRPATTKKWLESVVAQKNFRFTAKLWRGFTHERAATSGDERDFKDGFAPLLDAHCFGALLLQFPWSFRNDADNRMYVSRLSRQFADFPLVLEVRHASWAEPGVLDFLEQLGIGLCNIDQPLFKRSITPSALTTSAIGYVRLHGRNYKNWFKENNSVEERYDYLYTAKELEPWIRRAETIAQAAQDTYVVANNHYLGKAIVNAAEISSIIKGRPLSVPATLLEHYPELTNFHNGEKADEA